MSQSNFSIRQSDGDTEHIGTIIAESNEELAKKIAIACTEHFAIKIDEPKDIEMDNYLRGSTGEVKLTSNEDEEFRATIFICQGWIY